MEEIVNKNILDFLSGYTQKLSTMYEDYINDATALCAIFMIVYFSLKSYEMMVGAKKLDIIALLRPFALLMVILYWTPFVAFVGYPAQLIMENSKSTYEANMKEVNLAEKQRQEYMIAVYQKLVIGSKEAQDVENTSNSTWKEKMMDFGKDVLNAAKSVWVSVTSTFALIRAEMVFYLGKIIEFLVLCIFRACIYLIMFIQIVFSAILIILGPFSFAISILPAFKDAYVTWISRFISVSLYSGIGYLVLNIVMSLVLLCLQMENDKFKYLLASNNDITFQAWAAYYSPGSLGYFLVALLVGSVSMLTVPTISTWIVNTAGISSAVSTAGRGTVTTLGNVTKAGKSMAGV